jgi:hypothetical protein
VTKAETYRERAAECDEIAARIAGQDARLSFLTMANDWRALAEDSELRAELSASRED